MEEKANPPSYKGVLVEFRGWLWLCGSEKLLLIYNMQGKLSYRSGHAKLCLI